ncbi:sugar ABC transporter permease [Lachnoclostridium sp. An169]|uniref:ABC transporter permease n=1 Tax=Lachnoclostridium sp. An169 TaxID=1965569 RepID=UPI000B375E93|nr:ABC transporter permease subunit [Lachnoclostridium sp. An169]OUP84173.1 sugar ABC transporter permease [Lachnoclostridium sp. An169]HJA66601.1 ABC transporter permease subunit [Candidatus Mediterraneibacter cottocaccae]
MNQRIKTKKRLQKQWPFYIMIIPGMIYLLINNYGPMAGIFIAFKKIDYGLGIFKSPWVGLENFEYLFKTDAAFTMTRNTILYNVAFIVLGTVLGIAVGIMLSELRSKAKTKFFQTVILLPYLLSWVICAYIGYAFLSKESGLLNSLLTNLGFQAVDWYNDPGKWPVILIVVNIWKGIGYTSIIYMSTIIGIDKSLYEAARVDGATKWQEIRLITLPLLKSTIIMLTIMNIGRIFYSDFGLFYQIPLNSGTLYPTTQTIDTYVYRALMQQNQIGMSSAAGVYQSLVGFILVLAANMIVRKLSPDDAMF